MVTKRMRESTPVAIYNSQSTMRAVMWEGKPFNVAVSDIAKPSIQDPNDVIVRITASAVCGSDLHIYHGIMGSSKVPYGLGHEAVGYIVEIGSAVKTLKVGQRVIIPDAVINPTLQIEGSSLLDTPVFGLGADFGNLPGLQAEYALCPFAEASLVPVFDRTISDTHLLTLADNFATGWGGLTASGFQPGDSVVVFGAGSVGLLCAYSAILRGASVVYSVDHVRSRLEKARSIGAIPIDFTKAEVSAQILKVLPRGAKRVVDCVGGESLNAKLKLEQSYVINQAIKVASFQGGIGIIGVYFAQLDSKGTPKGSLMKPIMDIEYPAAWIKCLTISSGIIVPEPLEPILVSLVKNGRAKPGFVFTNEFDIEDAAVAYSRFDKKKETKVLFRFPWAGEEGCDVEWSAEVEDETTHRSMVSFKRQRGCI